MPTKTLEGKMIQDTTLNKYYVMGHQTNKITRYIKLNLLDFPDTSNNIIMDYQRISRINHSRKWG